MLCHCKGPPAHVLGTLGAECSTTVVVCSSAPSVLASEIVEARAPSDSSTTTAILWNISSPTSTLKSVGCRSTRSTFFAHRLQETGLRVVTTSCQFLKIEKSRGVFHFDQILDRVRKFDLHPSTHVHTMAIASLSSRLIKKLIGIASPPNPKLRPPCTFTNASRMPFISA